MLDAYLTDLKKRIDPAVENALLEDWKSFSLGADQTKTKSLLFSPRRERPSLPCISWPKVWVNDTPELNDMDMVYNHTVDKGIRILGLERKVAESALKAGRNLHGKIHIS
jgi:hypothetical protein